MVTAGTSDLPVAREAVRTLAFYGLPAREIADVGVAGLWRILQHEEELRRYPAVIVVAGMEGRCSAWSAAWCAGRDRGTDVDRLRRRARRARPRCMPRSRAARPAWSRSTSTTAMAPRAPRSACSARTCAPEIGASERRHRPKEAKSTPTPVDAWIPITIAAAFFQNLRSALQRHLKGRLSTTGATFSRFAYAAPLALLYVAALAALSGHDLPRRTRPSSSTPWSAAWPRSRRRRCCSIPFSFRNFAVGTTYSKTETVQTAIFGILILGDPLGLGAALAIVISLIGVMAISVASTRMSFAGLLTSWTEKPALIGLASGAFFGISAISYRGASLSLGDQGFLIRAAYTLACVTVFQTLVMALYMRAREPGQLSAVFRSWRVSVWAGVTGMIASAGWFTAMTIQNAAYVRALGQIELVFTFAAAVFFFHERPIRTEVIGILLVIGGILLLLLH